MAHPLQHGQDVALHGARQAAAIQRNGDGIVGRSGPRIVAAGDGAEDTKPLAGRTLSHRRIVRIPPHTVRDDRSRGIVGHEHMGRHRHDRLVHSRHDIDTAGIRTSGDPSFI